MKSSRLPIVHFRDEYSYLSNFHTAWIKVDVGFGLHSYKTREHAFQAAKATTQIAHDIIKAAVTPGSAKRMGRQVKPLRAGWDEGLCNEIMLHVVRATFAQHPDLAEKLLATEDACLIEGNYHGDRRWGVTLSTLADHHIGVNQATNGTRMWPINGQMWTGENRLGLILMQVRQELST